MKKTALIKIIGLERNVGLIPLETTDFSSAIRDWKNVKVELLWGNCPGPFLGAVWRQANRSQ